MSISTNLQIQIQIQIQTQTQIQRRIAINHHQVHTITWERMEVWINCHWSGQA